MPHTTTKLTKPEMREWMTSKTIRTEQENHQKMRNYMVIV